MNSSDKILLVRRLVKEKKELKYKSLAQDLGMSRQYLATILNDKLHNETCDRILSLIDYKEEDK